MWAQLSFAAASEGGIPSTILSRDIRTEEPTGLHIIQAAENAIGGVQRLEGAVAICKRVCLLIASPSVFNSLGMTGIVAMVKRQVPHMVDEVEGLSQWALVQGGSGSVHVDWLAKQHELHIPGRRKLKGELWMSLARDIPPRFVKVRRAITHMALSCPKTAMEGQYCAWLSPTEVKTLTRAERFLTLGDEIEKGLDDFLGQFAKGTGTAKHADVPDQILVDVDGRCENRLARLLCKKECSGLKKYESVSAVIEDAEKEIKACSPPLQRK